MKSSDYQSITETEGKRKKIIYVDDVNYSLMSVKIRLGKYFDIFPAESSFKLFEFLENIRPDLILLDVNMPDVDGYETIKSLKADERFADIPVIFLTGNSDRESVVKGLSLGAADYVIKPFSTPKLIQTIENELYPYKPQNDTQEDEAVNKPAVLVVDDVASMLRAIQYALRDRYKVFVLSKSADVIDFLKTKNPDLILLDYMMPALDGFDLIPIIKALPEHKETPIIIITTEGTQEHVNKAISLGASDFIVKPFKPNELNSKVARHIRISNELRRLREENEKLYG
ncbi:MAG: response regulator [Treponema sp.]|jgi:PleD family two-component response regulator|nr:response regulator [Treponema sp.]